jgi:hypothetical protein
LTISTSKGLAGLAVRITVDEAGFSLEPVPVASDPATHAPVPLAGADRDAVLAHCAVVRGMLEGKSVDSYREEIRGYDGEFRRMRAAAKREMYLHFAKNVYRYPPRLVLSSLRHLAGRPPGARP